MTATSSTNNPTKSPSRVLPYGILITAILAFALAANLIRMTQNSGIPSFFIANGRLAIAAIIFTPIILTRFLPELKAFTRSDFFWTIAAGFWVNIYLMLMIVSLEYTSVLINQVLVNTSPLWVAVMEVNFLKARMTRGIWLGLLLTMMGGMFIAGSGALSTSGGDTSVGENPILGITLALIGAIALGIYLVISRKVRANVHVMPYTWLVYLSGTIFTGFALLFTGTPIIGYSAAGYFWLFMVALFPQIIGFAGFNFALGHLQATIVSTSGQLAVVGSGFIAFIVFTEVPTSLELLGSAIIIIGVIYAILNQPKKEPSDSD